MLRVKPEVLLRHLTLKYPRTPEGQTWQCTYLIGVDIATEPNTVPANAARPPYDRDTRAQKRRRLTGAVQEKDAMASVETGKKGESAVEKEEIVMGKGERPVEKCCRVSHGGGSTASEDREQAAGV